MKASPVRVVLVTAYLSLLGAACGAVLGGLTTLTHPPFLLPPLPPVHVPLGLVLRSVSRLLLLYFEIGALGGSVLGALLTPIVGWLFLRRVPLGRAIRETAIGVGLGIAAGVLLPLQIALVLGLSGFVLAGGRLWWVTRPAFVIPKPLYNER
jgi:hypothetical protein